MGYLSRDLEVLAKRKKQSSTSLINKQYSCGIFQDYGDVIINTSKKQNKQRLD